MKRAVIVILALLLTACGGPKGEGTELIVFAAASLRETLTEIGASYEEDHPGVTLVFNFDSSGTLLTQIREGADCDLFISAAPRQIDALDGEGSLLKGTRIDLLENKVALAVPEGNPRGVESFDQLAELLKSGGVFLAMGGSDVPAGQYTQKILDYYGLDEEILANNGLLTYGSNVKEVAAQVDQGTVDCGIIYATDAFSAGLTLVDTAAAEMCGQVIYPAAVLNVSQHPGEARAFLDCLAGGEAGAVFARVGFTPLR